MSGRNENRVRREHNSYNGSKERTYFKLRENSRKSEGQTFSKSRTMRLLLETFSHSEEEALSQLKSLEFDKFKYQCTEDEFEALADVVRRLLNVDPLRQDKSLTFKWLVRMHILSTKSVKRKEIVKCVADEWCQRYGTLWVVRWLIENSSGAHLMVGVELVVSTLKSIDLSSECMTELLRKDHLVLILKESILNKFRELDTIAKQELVNFITNYLRSEDLSSETNLNKLIGNLSESFLWMLYYEYRQLWDSLFDAIGLRWSDFHLWPSYKACFLLYSWFKTGIVNLLLADQVLKNKLWYCERGPRLFFEFCLSVSDVRSQDTILNDLRSNTYDYVFSTQAAPFIEFILSPPSSTFNDILKMKSQKERMQAIICLRDALIPSLLALIDSKSGAAMFTTKTGCSIVSKLVMNLNDFHRVRRIVRLLSESIFGGSLERVEKTRPYVFNVMTENIAMDAFLFSVQLSDGKEWVCFSACLLDFCPPSAFTSWLYSCSLWRTVVKMLMECEIPCVVSKLRHRLKRLKPPKVMKSTEDIHFWTLVRDLNLQTPN